MSTQTLVLQYGLLAPTLNAELVDGLLFRANRLYNDLIEVHRQRKLAVWELDSDELKKKWAELKVLYRERGEMRDRISEMKASRPKGKTAKKKHKADLAALQAQVKELNVDIEARRDHIEKLRKEQWKNPAHRARAKQVSAPFRQKALQVRRGSGLYWGTYNLVYRSAEQAADGKKKKKKKSKKKSDGLPKFKRWNGEGSLGVQIQSNNPVAQLPESVFGQTHTQVQVDPVDPGAWDPLVRKGERKRLQRTKLRLRVDSERAKPIWAEWPMIMHRPLPPGARVTNVSVTRRKHANFDRWTAQFTVNWDAPDEIKPDQVEKAIALDFGWRKREEGELRVAYWCDTEGNHGELCLPPIMRTRLDFKRLEQGKRSENLDELKADLVEDFGDRRKLDEEVREATQHMLKWRAQWRFIRLLRQYGDKMPEAARNRLEKWAYRDRHLWQKEVGIHKRAIRNRNDIYAKWAAGMVEKYDLIVAEDLKVANLGKKAPPENRPELSDNLAAMNNGANRQRVEAAVGHFRDALINACRRTGKLIVKVPARNTSKVCADCGNKCKLGHEQIHTCEKCGTTFDRDFNAARNILARGLKVTDDPKSLAEAKMVRPPRPSRFASRHKDGKAKSGSEAS